MKNPDAIVIGAGVVGACSALSLTNAGLRVLVIDRGPVASGTTGAGEGISWSQIRNQALN